MTNESTDLVPEEFRHELIGKVIRGVVDGSLQLSVERVGGMEKEPRDMVINSWGNICAGVKEYCTGNRNAVQLQAIEEKIFTHWVVLHAYPNNVVVWDYSVSKVERSIETLNSRIDSTNNLLNEVLKVNLKIVEILESIGES